MKDSYTRVLGDSLATQYQADLLTRKDSPGIKNELSGENIGEKVRDVSEHKIPQTEPTDPLPRVIPVCYF